MARPRKPESTEPQVIPSNFNPRNLPVVKAVRFQAGVEQLGSAQTAKTDRGHLILLDENELICISMTNRRVVGVPKPQCKSWELDFDTYFKG